MRHLLRSLILYCLCWVIVLPTAAHGHLKELDGTTIALSSLAGKWVFINYWASWCEACVDEIAELNHFYRAKGQNEVLLFAVNYEGLSLPKQRALVQHFAIHYPSLDPTSLNSLHLGDIRVLPLTFVFDPEGHLYTTLYGGQTHQALETLIQNPSGEKKQDISHIMTARDINKR